MANDNLVSTNEGSLSQHFIDIILKLNRVGNSQEAICEILGLPIDKVRDVIANQIHDPGLIEQRLDAFKIKSANFRCPMSKVLMANPVLAPNGFMCERNEVEKIAKVCKDMIYKLDEYVLVKPLKQEITAFSISTLAVFQAYLQAEKVPESIMQVIIECLSVLDPVINLATFQCVFDLSLKSQQFEIIQLLKDKASPNFLLSLLNQLSKLPEFQRLFIILASMLLKSNGYVDPNLDIVRDIFIDYLTNDNLSKKTFKLAMELVNLHLTEERTDKMLMAVRKHEGIREADAVITELIIKQVYFKARQGKKDEALGLLQPLYAKPELRTKIIEVLDLLAWRNEKLKFMGDNYKQSLQRLEDQAPPGLVECLNLQQELNQAKLKALKEIFELKIEACLKIASKNVPTAEVQIKEDRSRMEYIESQLHSIQNQLNTTESNLSTGLKSAETNQNEAIAEVEAKLISKLEAFQDAIGELRAEVELDRVKGNLRLRAGEELPKPEEVLPILSQDTKSTDPGQHIPTLKMQFIQIVDTVPKSQTNDDINIASGQSPIQQEANLHKRRLSPDELLSKLQELFTHHWFHLKGTLSERPVSQKCGLYNSVFYLMLQDKQSLAFWHLLEICLKEVTGDNPELTRELKAQSSFKKVISKFSLLCLGGDDYHITEAEKTTLNLQLNTFCDTYRDASVAAYLLKKLNEKQFNDAVTVITRYLHSTEGNSQYRQQISTCCKMLALYLTKEGMNYFVNTNPTKVRDT